MKPEPLNTKIVWLRDYDLTELQENIKDDLFNNKTPRDCMFFKKDILSAVEWFESEIRKYFFDGNLNATQIDYLLKTKDKAFQDVVIKK